MKNGKGERIKTLDVINDMIIEELTIAKLGEEDLLWHRPWVVYPRQNYVTHREYNALNRLLLGFDGQEFFVTRAQLAKLKADLKEDDPRYAIQTFPKDRELKGKDDPVNFWETKIHDKGKWIARSWGHSAVPLYAVSQTTLPEPVGKGFTPRSDIESFLNSLGYTIETGGSEAFYDAKADLIHMPARSRFETETAYYQTLFHQIAHATGKKGRLNRWKESFPEDKLWGNREELTAEISSAAICLMFGFKDFARATVEYIDTWIKWINDDDNLFTYAGKQAEKILKLFNLA